MTLPPQVPQGEIDRLYPRIPTPWNIGEPIEIGDSKQLHEFESTLPLYLDNSAHTNSSWQGRPPLADRIRPTKPQVFQGRIADIVLVPLADPLTILVPSDRTLRGINGIRAPRTQLQSDTSSIKKERAVGFDLFAKATSSGRGLISTIGTSVLYLPASLLQSTDKYYRKRPDTAPYGLRRYYLTPTTSDPTAFDDLVRTSAERSRQVMRDNLGKVILAGFSQ